MTQCIMLIYLYQTSCKMLLQTFRWKWPNFKGWIWKDFHKNSIFWPKHGQLDQKYGFIFKNLSTITEEDCFQITRWTKRQFNDFSKFINSVYDTAGRTKDQLIAIYRYWLRKGIDQSSLAMFKNDKSQQQISHYLCQIRIAINKVFVPFYLGSTKGREFFIKN
jgi:hypothetical protein